MSIITDQKTELDTEFTFKNDGDGLIVEATVLVTPLGTTLEAVLTTHNDNVVNNSGFILSPQSTAILFGLTSHQVGSITNNSSGEIVGYDNGIRAGGTTTIVNHGEIFGLSDSDGFGVVFSPFCNQGTLTNDGKVFGRLAGVVDQSSHFNGASGGIIDNTGSGIIGGNGEGIRLISDNSLRTVISNDVNAIIRGGTWAIHAFIGAFTLTNSGHLIGGIDSGPSAIANDVVVNRGSIGGDVLLGPGDDLYQGLGTGSVTGTIHGGDDNDTFIADRAKETFFGDAGNDTFVFNSVHFSPPGAKHDVIGDFDLNGADKIKVHAIDADVTHPGHQHFVFIGTASFAAFHAAHPNVIGMLRFSAATHTLQGNVDGNLAGVEFAVSLPGVAAIHTADLIL
jgi:hypothetical protein